MIKSNLSREEKKLVRQSTRRTLSMSSSFNFEKMQALGFLYAMLPYINHYHKSKEKRIEAYQREWTLFNTTPTCGPYITGTAGALKMLEITGRIAVGYELEEGLHGPTMAFNDKTCVISLNGGDAGSEKAVGLGKMCKNDTGKGFLMGAEGVDDTDLVFNVVSGEFRALEFAPAVEILAYEIAIHSGIDLMKPFTPPKEAYFETHDFSSDPPKAEAQDLSV